MSGRKKKLTPEHEALILRTTEELIKKEGSFSLQCLMEQTGIHHVSDQNGYFFLQARKKELMSQSDKERRVEFARQMQSNYPQSVFFTYMQMGSRLFTTPWTTREHLKGEYGKKNLTV